jgi:hypothetical protein
VADEDDVEKRARAVQVRKSPQHELRNIRPTGVALVPAGANARVFVVVKEDDQAMKLKLTPTAKQSAVTALKQNLDTLNATFAALTGADVDEAAGPSEELGVLFKQAGDAMHGMAAQFGKKKPDDEDERAKKERAEKAARDAEVEKAGRVLSKTNEGALRAALASIKAVLDPLDAAAAAGGAPAPEVAQSVAKDDGALAALVAKSVAEAVGAQLAPVVKSFELAAANLGGALRAPDTKVIGAPHGGAPPAPSGPAPRPYDPRDLDTVFDKRN